MFKKYPECHPPIKSLCLAIDKNTEEIYLGIYYENGWFKGDCINMENLWCFQSLERMNKFISIHDYLNNQPERSKREDSQQCEMRCSEHCGNTVRDK
jgi:hypothetical protein